MYNNIIYRTSANSFRGNYSFLNLTLCTVTFHHSTYRCGNYSREETIRGNTVHMGGQFSNFAVQIGPVQYIKYSIARVVKATEFPP